MDKKRARELTEKYAVCQECGSDKIGKGEGSIYFDDMEFSRLCKCGWNVRVDDTIRGLLSIFASRRIIRKWNFEKHEYEDVENKYSAKLVIINNPSDLDEIIKCTNCGKEVTFGECWTSKQWQNDFGFGFPVCAECHQIERDLDNTERERSL